MNRRKAFVMALAAALAAILCAGGTMLLHQNAKAPEEYAGGTTEIDFAKGSAHTAGDAVLIPVPAPKAGAEETIETVDTGTEETPDADSAGQAHTDSAEKEDGESGSAAVLNEQPGNVWAEEEAASTGGSYTPRTRLPASDSIGTLKIPSIGLTVHAYDSADTMEDMNKGISHFQSTSYWDGNVCFSGHNGNRAYSFFGKLHKIKAGDTITYETPLGTRTYIVSNIWTISDDDWSHLERTDDNRLTLITCVSDPAKRLCVQAVEQ